jgi:hypothetical protein
LHCVWACGPKKLQAVCASCSSVFAYLFSAEAQTQALVHARQAWGATPQPHAPVWHQIC